MSASKRLLFEVKSKQYVLISRAGMIVPSNDMTIEQIHDRMLTQFHAHVANWNPVNSLRNVSKDKFFRTCKHLADDVPKTDEHSGQSLWRKYAEIKKYVVNQITPIYAKLLGPDGKLASGISMEEVLFKTRENLFKAEQKLAALKSKSQKGFVAKDFYPSWYPHEWEVFLLYGAPSNKPDKAFHCE